MERLGYQMTQAWDTGQGRMSFEEITGFLKNTAGYSDDYADAIIKKALPKLHAAGARNRKVAEDLLRANLMNAQIGLYRQRNWALRRLMLRSSRRNWRSGPRRMA